MSANRSEEDIVLLLVSNKDFKDWVLNPSGDRDIYWKNWMQSNPDKIQSANKAREIVQQLKFDVDFLPDEELQQLLGNIISGKNSEREAKVISIKRRNSFQFLKIAASILFLLAAGFYAYRHWSPFEPELVLKQIETRKGQRTNLTLPDGSIVYLNAHSALKYPESFSESTREVELMGEAFFEIVENPSKPFIVKTHGFQTIVLGTSFNVRAFTTDSLADVSLVTGKVRVTSEHTPGESTEHLLIPGERLVINKANGAYKKEHFDLVDITGWKDGVLVFNDTDFPGVIEKLEQWYGVDITVVGKPSEPWHVAGHFDNESLVEVLNSIQFVYDIEYTIKDNHLTLKCN